MKKLYEVPELEIIRFTIQTSVLSASIPEEETGGVGGDPVEPTLPDISQYL